MPVKVQGTSLIYHIPQASSIFAFPMGVVMQRVKTRMECNDEMLAELEREFKRFMCLCAITEDVTLAPPRRVDEVWHEFLLFTELYAEFTEQCVGRFVHHRPGITADSHTFFHRCYVRNTLPLYRQHFGDPPPHIWPYVEGKSAKTTCADCGDGCGDCGD